MRAPGFFVFFYAWHVRSPGATVHSSRISYFHLHNRSTNFTARVFEYQAHKGKKRIGIWFLSFGCNISALFYFFIAFLRWSDFIVMFYTSMSSQTLLLLLFGIDRKLLKSLILSYNGKQLQFNENRSLIFIFPSMSLWLNNIFIMKLLFITLKHDRDFSRAAGKSHITSSVCSININDQNGAEKASHKHKSWPKYTLFIRPVS